MVKQFRHSGLTRKAFSVKCGVPLANRILTLCAFHVVDDMDLQRLQFAEPKRPINRNVNQNFSNHRLVIDDSRSAESPL